MSGPLILGTNGNKSGEGSADYEFGAGQSLHEAKGNSGLIDGLETRLNTMILSYE
jgi:hypothetical protein